MGELVFVGLGMSGVDGMTVDALEELRSCDAVFGEFYTSTLIGGSVEDLEERIGKPIRTMGREEVEETDMVIEAAKDSKVAFVTPGDTMAATTHVDLRIQAAEEGVPTRIIHGISIFSACPSSLGLQPYKFGRTVTLPFPEPGYYPLSPYRHILENKRMGLHSLVLLDIKESEGRYMTAAEGIEWLTGAEKAAGEGLIDDETLICAAARIGSPTECIRAGHPDEMMGIDMGPPLHCLVIPGPLHFMEGYSLHTFAGAPESILNGL